MHLSLRWLQIAKKMLAKSKKEGGGDSSTRNSNTSGRRPLPHPASGQSLATVSRTFDFLVSTSLEILVSTSLDFLVLTSFDFLVSTSLDRLPLVQVGRVGGAHLPNFPRTFNGSENDLTLAYNSSLTRPLPGGRVRYNPDGRTSPEVGDLSWNDTDIKAFNL